MDAGVAQARAVFADRLQATFAIGSLAHGGFAPAASDVDLVLILADLQGDEADLVGRIAATVKRDDPSPLARRLSVFWSTWAILHDGSGQGRFPLADRHDLAEAGVLLWGADDRSRIALPSAIEMRRALICEGARFMLQKLATEEYAARLKDPAALVALGCRDVTKAVLFPARFLYTIDAGRAADNAAAVRFVARTVPGPVGELVQAAFRWRNAGRLDPDAATALSAGLLPLYARLTDVYGVHLAGFGEIALAEGVQDWAKALSRPRR